MLVNLNSILLGSGMYYLKTNKRIFDLFLLNRYVIIGNKKK